MNSRTIKVVCFAGLRKYFGSEAKVELADDAAFKHILEELARLNPEAKEVLQSCRIAVKEQFVALSEQIKDVDQVFLIPPSSGG